MQRYFRPSLAHSVLLCVLLPDRNQLVLISKILDLSSIEAGDIKLNVENISVNNIAQETLPFIMSIAESKNVEIINNIGNEKTYNVQADHMRLKQILVNLLTNAIKYNINNGRVSININQIYDGKLKIMIVDTGIGISSDEIDRIFQPFERLNNDQGVDGAGIGLAVTTQLVGAMGGKVGVVSEPEQGSTFWIELDAA